MSDALIPTPADTFEEWFRLPVTESPADSPFEVRRARPEEFERIYDTVDAAFGRKRPRALYDWMYCRNPLGLARCWVVIERASGDLIKTGASYPWPVWRGSEVLLGSIGGDAATLPHWQRKGLSSVRRAVRNSHPWQPRFCSIAGPNEGSRTVIRRSGRGRTILGRLRGGLALLRGADVLSRAGVPGGLARPVGAASDAFFSIWPGRGRSGDRSTRIETVRRFDTAFDAATLQHMAWPEFWCPHNADFLNWRYLDHPTESYVALALLENEQPTGYAVLRLSDQGATLSEFVVATEPRGTAMDLLRETIAVATEAGSPYLNFFATPGFRHWGTLRRAGFLPYSSSNYLEATCESLEPDVNQMKNWQVLPGDRDYH